MKTNPIGLLLLAFAIQTASWANAQAANDNREADHVALRSLKDKVVSAIEGQDTKALADCFTKDFALTTVTQNVLTNPAQIQEFFDRMFRGNDARIISLKTEPKAEIPTRFLSDDVGICYGTSRDTYKMKSGEVVEMDVRWTATVAKENGDWKVSTAHFGTDFMRNPVLDKVMSYWKKLVFVGCTAGILSGVMMGWLLGRRGRKVSA